MRYPCTTLLQPKVSFGGCCGRRYVLGVRPALGWPPLCSSLSMNVHILLSWPRPARAVLVPSHFHRSQDLYVDPKIIIERVVHRTGQVIAQCKPLTKNLRSLDRTNDLLPSLEKSLSQKFVSSNCSKPSRRLIGLNRPPEVNVPLLGSRYTSRP